VLVATVRFALRTSLVAALTVLAAVGARAELMRLPAVETVWSEPVIQPVDPIAHELPHPAADAFGAAETWAGGYDDVWCWQILPDGIIYKSYLAGVKESRLAAHLVHLRGDGWMKDGVLGGRFGVVRFGNQADVLPQGFQFDVEGSAHVRLDIPEEVDVRSADYRAGGVFTWGIGFHQVKFGYYHLSSHLGDEFVLKNLGFQRMNYARDVIILGYAVNVTYNLRLYAEAGWAFAADVAQPWEFQFGLDYAPAFPTGLRGAPFLALNAQLREELNYGGNFVLQTGWAWRSDRHGHLLRMGLIYYNGESNQFSFVYDHEEQIGFGIWYDF
jgi:hypothetical protein